MARSRTTRTSATKARRNESTDQTVDSRRSQRRVHGWRERIALAAIVCVGLLVYANAWRGPFVADDLVSIVDNPHVRTLWPPAEPFTSDRESPFAGRPLVNFSMAVNYAIGGDRVVGYHVVNTALHIVCATLVFALVRRTLDLPAVRPAFLADSRATALTIAMIWLVHPLNTEAVNYLTQRTELMMALFLLATCYAAVRAYESARSGWWQMFAVLCCAAGMFCKETMVVAPVIVLLYDRSFLYASFADAFRARWRFYSVLLATWFVLATLIWSGPRTYSTGFSHGVTAWMYLLNQAVIIVRYLRLAFWPDSLVFRYGSPRTLTFHDVLVPALLVASLVLAVATLWVRKPRTGFLGTWFFLTLAPTSSVVPIVTEVGAERRMYLPLIAVVTGAVLAAQWAWRRFGPASAHEIRRWAESLVVATIVLALGVTTVARNREYQSGLKLARTVLERSPTPDAHYLVGVELVSAGAHDEAIAELRQAVVDVPRARYALGRELFQRQEWSAALEQLQAFLRREPLLLEAVDARDLMGRSLMQLGDLDGAAEQFRLAIQMNPTFQGIHGRLAKVLFEQRRYPDAILEFEKHLVEDPNSVDTLVNLGISFENAGRAADAIAAFRRALAIDSSSATVHRNLAIVLLEQDDFAAAAAHARQAILVRPTDPIVHDVLGLALIYQLELDAGIRELQRSLELDPSNADAHQHLAAALEMRRRRSG